MAQQFVLGLAYQAGPDPRIRMGADGSRDFFTPEELERAAWEFLRSGRIIGLLHADGTTSHAEVVESFIWRWAETDIGAGVLVHDGDWVIGAVLDDAAWAMVQAGQLTGFSPQGSATRRTVRSEP